MSIDISATAQCRILTICSSRALAHGLISRVTNTDSRTDGDAIGHGGESPKPINIPWTISNKYYNARVHFHLAESPANHTALSSDEDQGSVPAIIFVWEKGQEYKAQFLSHSKTFQTHDPEVSLAVAVSVDPREIDQDEADTFFGEHGFEYIDGDSPGSNRVDLDDDEDPGVDRPGRARIIDALNSIMWPSMMMNQDTSKRTRHRSALSQEVIENASKFAQSANIFDVQRENLSSSDSHRPQIGDVPLFSLEPASPGDGAEEASQKWLNVEIMEDEWPASRTPATASTSPYYHPLGFDDDFTEFISAPLRSEYTSIEEAEEDVVERVGIQEEVPQSSDVDPFDDDALPSQAEIMSTSHQIFGGSVIDDEGGFDLSSILGTLQMLKEEIGEINDQDDRRKAAARIALGFVWGLEKDKPEVSPDEHTSEGEEK